MRDLVWVHAHTHGHTHTHAHTFCLWPARPYEIWLLLTSLVLPVSILSTLIHSGFLSDPQTCQVLSCLSLFTFAMPPLESSSLKSFHRSLSHPSALNPNVISLERPFPSSLPNHVCFPISSLAYYPILFSSLHLASESISFMHFYLLGICFLPLKYVLLRGWNN